MKLMNLHARLTLPLVVAAVVVTGTVLGGLVLLVRGTTRVVIRQTGHQLTRIAAHALAQRAEALDDVATVFASLAGDARARDLRWRHEPLAAVAILEPGGGRIRSWIGAALDPADLPALAGRDHPAWPVIRTADGRLLVAGRARDDRGGSVVVVGVPVDGAFADALAKTLQAGVEITAGGRTLAASRSGSGSGDRRYTATGAARTPGGAPFEFRVAVPADDVFRTQRAALALAGAGGLVLLAAAFVFNGWVVARITRPIRELTTAVRRVGAGEQTARLPADAPAELGELVAEFNRMAAALRETQDRLVHSAKLSSVGALVAGVSHELNNPLHGLLGHAEHLSTKYPEGDPAREKLETILREGRRMQRTLADLRGFTRPGGRQRATVDLNDVAREVLELVRHDAGKAGVECAADLAAGGAPIEAAPDRVRQVALNLALNAVQAMPAGGRLTIRTSRTDGAGTGGSLVVEDDGPGIAADVLARVTEPFFSTKPGRMGLGLSISREIVEEHGGSLTIASAPGRGARVEARFPAGGMT